MKDESGGSNDEDSDKDGEDGVRVEAAPVAVTNTKQITEIHDMSEKDLINLRRAIYLTIMSSAIFEEYSHKLSKLDVPDGKEMELIQRIIHRVHTALGILKTPTEAMILTDGSMHLRSFCKGMQQDLQSGLHLAQRFS